MSLTPVLRPDSLGSRPGLLRAGRNHGWKVEGDQDLGPNTGALALRALGAGRGHPLPLWGSGGITPRKNFENSDAKSCILVTTWQYLLWNFLLFENHGQEDGGAIHCWSPSTYKLGGPVSPVPTVFAPMIERHSSSCSDVGLLIVFSIQGVIYPSGGNNNENHISFRFLLTRTALLPGSDSVSIRHIDQPRSRSSITSGPPAGRPRRDGRVRI